MKLSRIAAALTAMGLASAAIVAGAGVATAAPAAPVLYGPQLGYTTPGSTVGISGTAPVGSTVEIWFHKRTPRGYTQLYTKRRSLTVGADGTFSTSYVANDDYRYFAQVGTAKSATDLTQIPVHIDGPATRMSTRYGGYHLTGLAIPYTVVKLHLHAKGTPANDYSITRPVSVQANGKWSFAIASDTDYRLFGISGGNLTVTPTYLLQER
jgi:hypothetical protein